MIFGQRKRALPRGARPRLRCDAVLFDVFGTLVDWRGSLGRYAARLGAERGLTVDWDALVAEWRSLYQPALHPVVAGERPWADFDTLHRETLETLLPKYGLEHLGEGDKKLLVRGWRFLLPWPEVAGGLHRLRASYVVGPLSNGSVRQLVDLARFGDLQWDLILGADFFHTYKPAPALYQRAVALLGTVPERVLMVAAHNRDLEAAQGEGLRTAFVRRATEDGEPTGDWDLVVDGLDALAESLGA